MIKVFLFILLFVFGISLSCKKKNVPCYQTIEKFSNDTIFPSDYLMTYPGSWWEYHDGTIDSCTNWEDVIYKEVSDYEGCEITSLDHHFLPRSTRFGLVADDEEAITQTDGNNTLFKKIIGENIGEILLSQNSTSPSTGGGATNITETTYVYHEHLNNITVQNQVYTDVQVIKAQIILYPSQGPSHLQAEYFYYYAKDVGFIKQLLVLPSIGNYDSLELINHFIAPH